jgi:hypothetical protein
MPQRGVGSTVEGNKTDDDWVAEMEVEVLEYGSERLYNTEEVGTELVVVMLMEYSHVVSRISIVQTPPHYHTCNAAFCFPI